MALVAATVILVFWTKGDLSWSTLPKIYLSSNQKCGGYEALKCPPGYYCQEPDGCDDCYGKCIKVKETAGWQRYTNQEAGYSVLYLKDWGSLEEKDNYPPDKFILSQVRFYKMIEDYSETYLIISVYSNPNFVAHRIEESRLPSKKEEVIIKDFTWQKNYYEPITAYPKIIEYTIVYNDKKYFIVFYTPEEDIISQVIESFTFLPSDYILPIKNIHYGCCGGDEFYECREFVVSFENKNISYFSYPAGEPNSIYNKNISTFSEEYSQLLIDTFNKIKIKEDGGYYDRKCSEASYEERPRPLGEDVCSMEVTYKDDTKRNFNLDHLACVEDKNIINAIDIIEKIVNCDAYMGHYYYLEEECKRFFPKYK